MSRENFVFYKEVDKEVESGAVKSGSYTKTKTVLWWYKKCSEEYAQRIEDKYKDVRKQKVEFPLHYLDHDRIKEDANSSSCSDLRHRSLDWKLDEEEENELFEAVCNRYSLSYGIEDKGYFDYAPHPEPNYDFKVKVKKWTARSSKVHIGKARYDEDEERWVIAYDESSGWT